MIKVMHECYAAKPSSWNTIDEFEVYHQADTAIDCFMNNELLNNLLTESLEKHDINKLFKLRYFITDLFAQISRLKQEQSSWYEGYEGISVSFYDAKIIDSATLRRLDYDYRHKEKKQIFRQFFTATTSKYDAGVSVGVDFEKKYALHNPWVPPDSDKAFVLFTLHIPIDTINSVPWVYYASRNKFRSNIIFPPGSLFKVDSVARMGDVNNVWYIKMSFCQDDRDTFCKLFDVQL
jgi:hypothetical protein